MGRTPKSLLYTSFLAILACTSNAPTSVQDNSTPPEVPDISTIALSVPQNAPAEIQTLISAANGFSGLATAYIRTVSSSQATFDSGSWSWSYTNKGLTIDLVAEERGEDTVAWTLTLNGTESATGLAFNNWVAVTGTSTKDGSSGDWTIYNLNETSIAATATWQTDASGTISIGIAADTLAVSAESHQDGSGKIEISQNGIKIYMATWTASGGTWFSYDPTTGQQTGSDSWSS